VILDLTEFYDDNFRLLTRQILRIKHKCTMGSFGYSNGRDKGQRHSSTVLGFLCISFLLVPTSIFYHSTIFDKNSIAQEAPSRVEESLFAFRQKEYFHVKRTPKIPLIDLVNSERETCAAGLSLVEDDIIDKSLAFADNRKIPRIVHVTSRTRCMPPEFVNVINKWRFPEHSFFFHNEVAMQRLLGKHWPEFPQLQHVLRCTKGGAAKADLWRALVMWEYGGIYTDIDNSPNKFNGSTISPNDDAFFVVERSSHLSQYFFAARPKHPLFFLLVHHMMNRLSQLNDVSMQIVSLVTGPGATRESFCNFVGGQGPNFPNHNPSPACWFPTAGTYTGMYNYTVTAVGNAENPNEYVARDVIANKSMIYKRMNMTYFRDIPKIVTKQSCIQKIYQEEGYFDPKLWQAEANVLL
jgi:hypothetical protein